MPSFILIPPNVWLQYTYVADRTDTQRNKTGQRSNSVGRTVLQTVAQKWIQVYQSYSEYSSDIL